MSRRHRAEKREVLPDPKFGDVVLSRFMNVLMYDGKKSTAEGIVYGAMDTLKRRGGQNADPLRLFHEAMDNVKPAVEVRSRRVGGATYQVPVEVRPERRQALAIRWLIECRPQARRAHDGGPPLGRADGRGEQPRFRRQEARRHAPDGRSQQGLQPLPLVSTENRRRVGGDNPFQVPSGQRLDHG